MLGKVSPAESVLLTHSHAAPKTGGGTVMVPLCAVLWRLWQFSFFIALTEMVLRSGRTFSI